jgi:hypothetical protein
VKIVAVNGLLKILKSLDFSLEATKVNPPKINIGIKNTMQQEN